MNEQSAVSVGRCDLCRRCSLSSETRHALLILYALVEHDGPVRFSTLREEVGVRESGKLNYHLGKLTDSFSGELTC